MHFIKSGKVALGLTVVTFLVVAFFTVASPAQTVVNGDFETLPAAGQIVPGWTPASLFAGGISGGGTAYNYADNGADTTHVLFMQGDSEIDQTIAGFQIGTAYTLHFEYNATTQEEGFAPPPFGVSIGGQSFDNSAVSPVDPTGVFVDPYYQGTVTFTAGATTETLSLGTHKPINNFTYPVLVDNITFAPEPGSAGMLFIVIGSALGRRRCTVIE